MTYFAKVDERDAAPSRCPGCDKWFVANRSMEGMSCTVAHGAGSCCHFAETEVTAPLQDEAPAPVPAVPREETRSTVRCQKCGHTGVPSPTVVLDLEAEIRELKAERDDALTRNNALFQTLKDCESIVDVTRALNAYVEDNAGFIAAWRESRTRSGRVAGVPTTFHKDER